MGGLLFPTTLMNWWICLLLSWTLQNFKIVAKKLKDWQKNFKTCRWSFSCPDLLCPCKPKRTHKNSGATVPLRSLLGSIQYQQGAYFCWNNPMFLWGYMYIRCMMNIFLYKRNFLLLINSDCYNSECSCAERIYLLQYKKWHSGESSACGNFKFFLFKIVKINGCT